MTNLHESPMPPHGERALACARARTIARDGSETDAGTRPARSQVSGDLPPRLASARGFTLVELIASVGVFAIGVTGVVALQRATTESNATAREMVVANEIAQAWASALAIDAQRWRWDSAGNLPTDTTWLRTVGNVTGWFPPAYNATMAFGPFFNAFGAPLPTADGSPTNPATGLRYCAQIRLSWLCQPGSLTCPTLGNGLIRADIEVFWPRRHTTDPTLAARGDFCVAAPTRTDFHIVTLTTSVAQEAQR